MPQSLSRVLVHLVFSTKNRVPCLTPAIQRELHPYLAVALTNLDCLITYIQNQAQHHEKMTFQDEYRRLLERYCIPYDERYAWD
jgi:hypothetical protein